MTESTLSNNLPATNEDTIGPYFPIPFCPEDHVDMTQVHPGLIVGASGTQIILTGELIDKYGNLANGSVVEFWQPNAAGIYRTPHTSGETGLDPYFTGYARLRSKEGRFSVKTVLPGVSQSGGVTRAPNITITIFSDGINRIVTQIFFEGEEHNENDPLMASLSPEERGRLIAKRMTDTDGMPTYHIGIVMAGENETPFFDDLES